MLFLRLKYEKRGFRFHFETPERIIRFCNNLCRCILPSSSYRDKTAIVRYYMNSSVFIFSLFIFSLFIFIFIHFIFIILFKWKMEAIYNNSLSMKHWADLPEDFALKETTWLAL